MKCPACGKRIPSTIRVCKHCGERVPRSKKRKGSQPKISLLSWLSPRQRFLAGLGVLGMLIIVLLLIVLPLGGERREIPLGRAGRLGVEINIEKGKTTKEIAANAVYGEVIAAYLRANRRGRITVKSLHTGRIYAFSVGWQTSYHPLRSPFIGERVKVYYTSDQGSPAATQVIIEP
jgi:hypothetical protein